MLANKGHQTRRGQRSGTFSLQTYLLSPAMYKQLMPLDHPPMATYPRRTTRRLVLIFGDPWSSRGLTDDHSPLSTPSSFRVTYQTLRGRLSTTTC